MQLADISAVGPVAVGPVMEQGLLRRLLWPRISSERDAQLVGQQGQWLCTVVGSVWMIGGWFTLRPWLCLVIGAMFVLAGVGVRQHRVSAAVLAFLCLFLDRLAALVALLLQVPGGGNPRIGIVAMLLLLLNIRATWLAHRGIDNSLVWSRVCSPAGRRGCGRGCGMCFIRWRACLC